MPASKAQQKAVSKYMKQNYDEIKVRVKKGHKAEIKSHADKIGESVNNFVGRAIDESVNSFIIRAIDQTIERDNQTK